VSDREQRAVAAEKRRTESRLREQASRVENQVPRDELVEGRRVAFASREMGPGCEYSTRQMIEPPFPYEQPPIGILK
jgi:hypothetical protein